jgi:hypothetical protein
MSKRVKLALNIGIPDARKYGLTEVREGKVVSVEDAAARELIAKGWASEPDEPSPQSAPAEGVEAEAPEPVDLDAMTKEDLHVFAQHNAIDGVSMAQSKDDMLRTIKRALRK